LDKTITVFRYLTDKDIFERYYKTHLSKRLLLGRSISDDAERGMLAKLKVESGFQFTQKMEGMFNDMKLSADTMEAYKTHLEKTTVRSPSHRKCATFLIHRQPPDIDLSVIVMTATYWPMTHTDSPCTLPLALSKTCGSFEQFYLSRHSGRRLSLQPALGNADVKVAFKARKIELNVSTFALVILLLFEDVDDDEFLTYTVGSFSSPLILARNLTLAPHHKEIKEATSIADSELQRNLQSLACAKYKILKKHPPGREVNDDDSFSFNNEFTSSLLKLKINTISSRVESNEERKETRDRIDEERKHQTEVCLISLFFPEF
jgi:cullin 3